MLLYAGLGQVGHQMAGTDGGRLYGLVVDQTVYAALDAIDEALEQAVIAPTEREQRWQLNQLRGLLLTLRSGDLSLEDCLRRLIRLLRTPMIDRYRTAGCTTGGRLPEAEERLPSARRRRALGRLSRRHRPPTRGRYSR